MIFKNCVRWVLSLSSAVPLARTSLHSFEKHPSQGALARHFQGSIKKTAILLMRRGCSSLLSVHCKIFPFCVSLRITYVTTWSHSLYSFVSFSHSSFTSIFHVWKRQEEKLKTNKKQMQKKSPTKDNFAAGSLNCN